MCGESMCAPQMGGARSTKRRKQKGGCGCGVPLPLKKGGYRSTAGGYRSTKRDRQFLRLWKKGLKSINASVFAG